MKKLIVDLDDTISITIKGDYVNSRPIKPFVEVLRKYREEGFEIVINTARNMRTYQTNVGKINKYTLPNILSWLQKHDIPFDEIYVGKPWCGFDGFYIDDKAIRPSEFIENSYEEIIELLRKEKEKIHSLK